MDLYFVSRSHAAYRTNFFRQGHPLNFTRYSQRYVRPLLGWYLGGIVLLAATNLINLEIPQLAKEIINFLSESSHGIGRDEAHTTALTIVGLGVLLILIRSLSRILIFWPGRQLETTTKSDLFAKLLAVPEAFFSKHGMGDLISRLANDVSQLRIFFAFGMLQILNMAFLLVFTIAKMTSIHGPLTAFALLPLLIMVVVTRISMPKMHQASRDNQAAVGRLTNRVTEAFVNVHVIQANAANEAFAKRVYQENDEVFATNMRMVYVRTLIFPLMTCLAGISQLVVLFYGGLEVTKGRLSVGDIMAFNVYIGLLTFPLTAMGIILAVYQRAKTALDRIGEIDGAPTEKDLNESAKPKLSAPTAAPLLKVENLTFRHESHQKSPSNEEKPCIQGLSFEITSGKRIGLYGKVGSGKSTLFNLITRLLTPPPGTIFLGGRDILEMDAHELRRTVGYALQSVHLFSANVRENLAFGMTPPPSDQDLEKAAKQAEILDEIKAFPDQWQTEIGEKGVRLSGGQKQRLALARLLLRAPPVLLLDDVLSAVDHSTEKKLLDHLYALGSALIIASHRGSALKRCDEIIVLGHGEILGRGTFDSLVPQFPELALDT